jgi:hypothetical protein
MQIYYRFDFRYNKGMRRTFIGLMLLVPALTASGCGQRPLGPAEREFLDDIVKKLEPVRAEYREFDRFDEGVERGPNFISFSRDLDKSGGTPLMNPAYFWLKISLADDAVEALDLQPPVLTVFVPRFKKYLKLRLVTSNALLSEAVSGSFYDAALEAGGTDPHWGNMARPATRGRLRRH